MLHIAPVGRLRPRSFVMTALLVLILALAGCRPGDRTPQSAPDTTGPGPGAAAQPTRPEPPVVGPIDLTRTNPLSLLPTPPPEGEGPPPDLMSVWFVSQTQGFAATAGGQIHRTADAGRSWRLVATRNEVRFHRIEFAAGGQLGWALGQSGCPKLPDDCAGPDSLMITSDGGSTWTPAAGAGLPRPNTKAGRLISSLRLLDPDKGYALTTPGGSEPAQLLLTRDGGESWQPARLPGGLVLSGYADFLTPDHGWVTGFLGQEHQLLETQDGGRTWQLRYFTTEFALRAVQFLDAQHGFLGGGNGDRHWRQGPQQPRRVLLSTADGGKTWTEVSRTDEREAGPFKVLRFESLERGWASDGLSFEGGGLLSTLDGGKTWTRHLAPRVVMDFSAVGNQAWTVWNGGSHAFLYHTVDRGENWSTLFHPATVGVSHLRFAGERVGWANTNVGYFRTDDGGATWRRVRVGAPIDPWQLPAWPYVIDDQTALAYEGWSGPGRLLRSRDGGRTWSPSLLMGIDEPRLSQPKVSFVSPTHGFMALPSNRSGPGAPYPDYFLETKDGGETWLGRQTLPLNSVIDFADDAYGIAAGGWDQNATLMLTSDGGTGWTSVPLPGLSFQSADRVGAQHIWAAARNDREGLLLHSADGGRTWTIYTASAFEPRQVLFVTPEKGWLLTNFQGESVLARTEDGGETWHQVRPVFHP